jgi:HNH endonuclease/AP2 domain
MSALVRELPLVGTGERLFLFALVDAADFEHLLGFRWNVDYHRGKPDTPRCRFRKEGRQHSLWLHRYLLGAPDGLLVDHINHNPLDNRRSNLRLATPAENARNRKRTSKHATGYKGVRQASAGCWVARIVVERRETYLGAYGDPVRAALAYDQAARSLFGEFACCNFPANHRANWRLLSAPETGVEAGKAGGRPRLGRSAGRTAGQGQTPLFAALSSSQASCD